MEETLNTIATAGHGVLLLLGVVTVVAVSALIVSLLWRNRD